MKHNVQAALLIGATLIAASACDSKKADETAKADSAAASAMAQPATPPAPPALTDANIVYILDRANAADSARGALAATKGTVATVKEFGKMTAKDHHGFRAAGEALAKKLNVTAMMPTGDTSEADASAQLTALNAAARGAAWDKAYIDYEITYDKALLETATKALGAAQNQELKDLITKAAPVIQKHLDRALLVQKNLAK